MERAAWLASSEDKLREIYIYGPTNLEQADAALKHILPDSKYTLFLLPQHRTRRLIAPLYGGSDSGNLVVIEVTEKLYRDIGELRVCANNARRRTGGNVSVSLRGTVTATALHYIDPEAPTNWWGSFAAADSPAWVPDDVETEHLVQQTATFRSESHGLQVWDAVTDRIRFTCYQKNFGALMESSGLEELLYPLLPADSSQR